MSQFQIDLSQHAAKQALDVFNRTRQLMDDQEDVAALAWILAALFFGIAMRAVQQTSNCYDDAQAAEQLAIALVDQMGQVPPPRSFS